MTDKVQEAIDAFEELLDSIESVARDMRRIDSGECLWEKDDAMMFATNIEHDVKKYAETILKALQQRDTDQFHQVVKMVDVEKLKRNDKDPDIDHLMEIEIKGYNQAIDDMNEAGYLSVDQEQEGMAQAYIVIGNIMANLDIDSPELQRALDYFCTCKYDEDFLPWGIDHETVQLPRPPKEEE